MVQSDLLCDHALALDGRLYIVLFCDLQHELVGFCRIDGRAVGVIANQP